MAAARPTRVLIVDDSALMRHRLRAVVGKAAGFEVAGVASNGAECLARLSALQPDVVTLDVEMPGMDGLSTLRHIMVQRPTPVVMVSSLTEAGGRATLEALALGAVDYLAKPALAADMADQFAADLIHKLAIAATVRVAHPVRPVGPAPRAYPPGYSAVGRRDSARGVVVIGSSTGGPQALDVVMAGLPAALPAAILIVQHMPPVFTRSLAERLARRGGPRAREAAEGDRLETGLALVAPGGLHLTLDATRRVRLDQSPSIHGVRPAIDRTLLSLADCRPERCLIVILTGMGKDGTAGARALRERGARVLAQDESTSVVYGMPRSIVEAGLASAVLPLPDMAAAIVRWAFATSAAERVRV